MSRPNIIYMHSHDTGRYVQPYGHAVATPHIQRFAEQGVLFRKAFCANPTCSPSRAALLTGQYAHSAGMMGLAHRGFAVRDMGEHLVNTLGPAGYRTALAGVQHVARDAEAIGYDAVLPIESKRARDVAPAAAAFVHDAAKHGRPFFLDVGFFETHRKFPEPDTAHDPRYILPPAPLPDMPATRRDMAAYSTMAAQLDDGIGQVLRALDEAGLAERTLVIITTDHGIAFPGMKCNLTDHGIGVMLLMRGPATPAADGSAFTGGKVVDSLVSHVDLFPTICDAAGIEHPAWLQGRSLTPLATGEAERVRDEVFAEVNFHAAYEPQRAVRTERYKYIRQFAEHGRAVLTNCDDSPSKHHYLEQGWAERPVPREALFDLVFDPQEQCNLAEDVALADVVAEMRGRLDRWMRETDDPILAGPLAVPAGARVNAVGDRSPSDPVQQATAARPEE